MGLRVVDRPVGNTQGMAGLGWVWGGGSGQKGAGSFYQQSPASTTRLRHEASVRGECYKQKKAPHIARPRRMPPAQSKKRHTYGQAEAATVVEGWLPLCFASTEPWKRGPVPRNNLSVWGCCSAAPPSAVEACADPCPRLVRHLVALEGSLVRRDVWVRLPTLFSPSRLPPGPPLPTRTGPERPPVRCAGSTRAVAPLWWPGRPLRTRTTFRSSDGPACSSAVSEYRYYNMGTCFAKERRRT